jgi:predicted dehydrogenase
VNQRLRELVTSGELGDVQQVAIELSIPGPPDNDPRWSLELAGGATMDLGCYVLNAARQVGRWLAEVPSVVSAEATLKKPNVDASMRVELDYSRGIRGRVQWDMDAKSQQMVWTVAGTEGTAVVPAFAVPHMDNRIVITRDGSTEEQTLGDQTSYTYQLAALADTLQTGAEFLIDVDDSVANAALIDEVYRRPGSHLAARTTRLLSQDGWRGILGRSEHSLSIWRRLTCKGERRPEAFQCDFAIAGSPGLQSDRALVTDVA